MTKNQKNYPAAYAQGVAARERGIASTDAPYDTEAHEYAAWLEGYDALEKAADDKAKAKK